jgi:hypothetical protein
MDRWKPLVSVAYNTHIVIATPRVRERLRGPRAGPSSIVLGCRKRYQPKRLPLIQGHSESVKWGRSGAGRSRTVIAWALVALFVRIAAGGLWSATGGV